MEELLARLPGDPIANTAAVGVVVLALLDFLVGSARALAGGTFVLASFSTWVRAQLLGHVVPIILMLTFGQVIGGFSVGDFDLNVLVIAGLAAAASYAATTAGSLVASFNRNDPDPVPPPAT